jgi:hypothetical protein
LVPGTKGSGKSALFRIFVEILPKFLLIQRKVVVAHGIQAPGDPVFHAFTERFKVLSEDEFVSFWCIYLVSLAHEHFIKGPSYESYLKEADVEIDQFRRACERARIPEIRAKKTLKDILDWSLGVLGAWRPKIKFQPPGDAGEFELDLFGEPVKGKERSAEATSDALPNYVNDIRTTLEAVLAKTHLPLWLMVDRLDEIFPRRSDVERKALRGLLRAMRYFKSNTIRVKVFLRDDMLEQVVRTPEGFTALTHVTVRQADTLRWTQDQILAMVVKRLFANWRLTEYVGVDKQRLEASAAYRAESFGKVFPPTVFRAPKQSPTIRWIYNRCADGRGVVTPRDVLELLIRARQRQHDAYAADPEGQSEHIIGAAAIQYGFEELSKRKRQTYLQAEFPHLWPDIDKFAGGKTEYSVNALQSLLGSKWKAIAEDLVGIGFFSKNTKHSETVYSIPILYRHGMSVTRGRA